MKSKQLDEKKSPWNFDSIGQRVTSFSVLKSRWCFCHIDTFFLNNFVIIMILQTLPTVVKLHLFSFCRWSVEVLPALQYYSLELFFSTGKSKSAAGIFPRKVRTSFYVIFSSISFISIKEYLLENSQIIIFLFHKLFEFKHWTTWKLSVYLNLFIPPRCENKLLFQDIANKTSVCWNRQLRR